MWLCTQNPTENVLSYSVCVLCEYVLSFYQARPLQVVLFGLLTTPISISRNLNESTTPQCVKRSDALKIQQNCAGVMYVLCEYALPQFLSSQAWYN